jgi:hypothetical protein
LPPFVYDEKGKADYQLHRLLPALSLTENLRPPCHGDLTNSQAGNKQDCSTVDFVFGSFVVAHQSIKSFPDLSDPLASRARAIIMRVECTLGIE